MGLFCPKCGSLLRPKSLKSGTALACSCGYTEKNTEMEVKESVKRGHDVELSVIEKEAEEKRLPITEAECPKCGHRKAYYWLQQTRAGDEPETKFCKCEKCKHTWREYD